MIDAFRMMRLLSNLFFPQFQQCLEPAHSTFRFLWIVMEQNFMTLLQPCAKYVFNLISPAPQQLVRLKQNRNFMHWCGKVSIVRRNRI